MRNGSAVHGVTATKQALYFKKGCFFAIQAPFMANSKRNDCIPKESLRTSCSYLAPGFSAMVPWLMKSVERPKITNPKFLLGYPLVIKHGNGTWIKLVDESPIKTYQNLHLQYIHMGFPSLIPLMTQSKVSAVCGSRDRDNKSSSARHPLVELRLDGVNGLLGAGAVFSCHKATKPQSHSSCSGGL